MRAFTNVLVIASLAVAVSAANLPAAVSRLAANTGCANAKVLHTSHVMVGDKQVDRVDLACTKGAVAREPATDTTTTSPVHVCGQSCITSCSNVTGILPPTSEDCDTIVQAFKIFEDSGPSSFVAQPLTMTTFSFGTCAYMFENNSPSTQLEYCFSDLAVTAPEAGAACFPPHQPFFPQGWCTGAYGLWAAGASHS